MGYPEEVKKPVLEFSACFNNAVWDVKNMTIVKVGKDGAVGLAFNGF
jgi:hypothetical protein